MKPAALLRDPLVSALIAGTLLVIGIFALSWPVELDEYDRWGFRIDCGTGFASSYDQAAIADQQAPSPPQSQSGYVDGCQSAVLWRRGWASAVLALGVGAGLVLLLNREDGRVSE